MKYHNVEILQWVKSLSGDCIDLASSGVKRPQTLNAIDVDQTGIPLIGDNLTGYTPLKEVLAARYSIEPSRIATTMGASMANYLVLAALLNRGDTVAVEAPVYEPFLRVPHSLTGKAPVFLHRDSANLYKLPDDSRRLRNLKPKVLILTNLHNPTGVYSDADLIVRYAEEVGCWDGWILIDEIFMPFLEDGETVTSAVTHDRIIATNSLTKAYGLSSLRAGWVIGTEDLIRAIQLMIDSMHVYLPFVAEHITWQALTNGSADRLLTNARRTALSHWQIVRPVLCNLGEIEFTEPDGGISVWIRFRDGRNTDEFCSELLRRHNTLVTPGRFFGCNDCLRLSYGTDRDNLARGLEGFSDMFQAGE